MAGTRTAPAIDGTADYKRVSVSYIDASGDIRTDSQDVPAAATSAQIEAVVDALQAVINSSIYKVEVSDVYNSVGDSSNAVDAPKDSLHDNLVFLAKNTLNLSKRLFIPSPIADVFIAGTDTFDGANTDLATLLDAQLTLWGAGWSYVSGRYTERREINQATRF